MDVIEFQKKLGELCALAKRSGDVLEAVQIREFFEGMDLKSDQLLKVLQYLKQQGISIEGAEASGEKEDEARTARRVPLTVEEEAYLKEYKAGLASFSPDERAEEELFKALADGSGAAKQELAGRYFGTAADLAVEYNCEEIFLGDLIQEANVSLLMALDKTSDTEADHQWLCGEIRRGIQDAIAAQTQRNYEDDCLVKKVEKLESEIRELTEDDEGEESQFTIDELAVILDMDVEEIRNVLRLTGDDK